MGKITTQSLEEKSVHESMSKLEEVFQAEIRIDEVVSQVDELKPLYDDEIGLWEELESRYRRRAQAYILE